MSDIITPTAPRNLPEESPIAMPEQRFFGNPPGTIEVQTQPQHIFAKRLVLILATLLLGVAGTTEIRIALGRDGFGIADMLLMAVFFPLFCWIAFGFISSSIGFLKLITGDHPGFTPIPRPVSVLSHRTAILMPIYNESVEAVFARVKAMTESVARAGGADYFDFFVLSDSKELNGKREEEVWAEVAAHAPINVYYRRRPENIGRKPGNIEEWVKRFGGAYEHMIVLDADSMMSGSAMVGMASILENKPSVGLLQTVPQVINAQTLFQRWMQFAGYAYGPIASAGLLWWSGTEANFWGHNAIVRTRAFAESCGLPVLPGKPPFGGHIQSHDMVESALLRRRGWAVHMVMIDGSYEEFPPTIIDNAIRDRRWMQGNLQHLRLIDASGFHWAGRLQLLIGASAYCTSPAWLVLILTTLIHAQLTPASVISDGLPGFVLALTAVILFGPKIMSGIWVLANKARRESFGGAKSVIKSVALEAGLAVLLAPITMVMQTKALVGLLLGIPSHWTEQVREVDGLSVGEVLPHFREHLALAALFIVVALVDPVAAAWLTPVTLGLLVAPWLVSWTSSKRWGDWALGKGLFIVPPPIIDDTERSVRPPERQRPPENTAGRA
ncbi:glucans biosynthesis glucosyltransferase MdoH [Altericroceibacterium endophyticum]|uniref:Glucans biosynthesis glucosyltransferase H n=1 Tax=Altericroceibacterium endophyticum TaxID=1808508 RepID=A0A6I4T7B4_9SPHN|nr:glucans biosynthesis glucosyltransferase MdoH [Altericroceibacterium endophyticum]MXO65750.1 glucans biosynthesis glucosyltransferase MdoH [Altericroceibacterium endophyticum]